MSATSDWRHLGGSSKAVAAAAAEEVQVQRGAESSKAKGRSSWAKMQKRDRCTQGKSLFKEVSLARAPRCRRKSRPARTKEIQPLTRGPGPTSHTVGVRVSRCEEGKQPREGEPPPAAVHLFISTESSGPASNTGAWAHESYSLGVGLRVRRRRTATRGANNRASSSPPKAVAQPLTWGPRPSSHTPWALVYECQEGEPPRKERTTMPLHSTKTNGPVSDMGARAPESSSLGAGSWVQRSRTAAQYCAPSGPSKKTEKVNF
jgi:hypothetical protein